MVVVIDNVIVVGIYKFYIIWFGGWLYFFIVFGICVYFFLIIEIFGCRDKLIIFNRIFGFGFIGSDVLVGRIVFDRFVFIFYGYYFVFIERFN